MSTSGAALLGPVAGRAGISTAGKFAAATILVMAGAALLAGWAPLGFSIVTVLLFAGPHNWVELRYFLSRMPGRWGKLRGFFLFSFGGIFSLVAAFAALPWLGSALAWSETDWPTALAIWNSLLLGWIGVLIHMRSRQNPRRDWSWTVPVLFVLLALNWLSPQAWDLGLVYLHPLMAFWILDREIRRSRPEWRSTYHACLACVPLVIGLIWWRLADSPNLPGNDVLTARITQHAGADILQGVSSHLLVATHTFLEMLHYGVWMIAIPLVSFRCRPWNTANIPLARRSPVWRRTMVTCVAVGAIDRKSTRLNSSHIQKSRMPSSA